MVSAAVARAPAVPTVDQVWAALAGVPDPEIPAISIVDLGIVHRVTVGGGVGVELLPTFIGCPALDVIRDAVRERLVALAPGATIDVRFTFAEPWTSDRITPTGREQLRRSGFAPPAPGGAELVQLMPRVACPYCGSRRTRLENSFGPALCRATHYCADCRQPFEAFKPV